MNYYLPPMEIYKQPWTTLCNAYETNGLIDRSRILDLGFKYTLISEIPSLIYTNTSFEDITDNRIKDIIQNASNPILLLWSGGIDSTVAFSALLKAGVAFTVGYSTSSIKEYPLLYNQLQKQYYGNQIDTIQVEDYYLNNLQNNYHIVTGNLGDQIVGNANHYTVDGSIRPKQLEPYVDVLPEYLITLFEKVIDAFPIEFTDYADWLWWFNFNLKYQAQQLEHAQSIMFDVTNTDSYSAFFDSSDFQSWAMSNRSENKDWIRKGIETEYKQIYKRYIFSVLHDYDYFKNKRKEGSIGYAIKKNRERTIYIVNENNKMKIIEY